MHQTLSPPEFYKALTGQAVVDVRHPGAYALEAFPEAVSIPAQGLSAAEWQTRLRSRWPDGLVYVYDQEGDYAGACEDIPDVVWLEGGYANWQMFKAECFLRGPEILILGGKTGSGKTEWLHALAEAGEQVLDLEGMAGHKGSVFGNLEGNLQPSNSVFQSRLFHAWYSLDVDVGVWIEEEGPMLGKLGLPEPLYGRMLAAPMVELEVPFDLRLRHLLDEYGNAPSEAFDQAIQRLEKRMGRVENHRALHQYRAGKKRQAFERLLTYYDSAYVRRRESERTGISIPFSFSSPGLILDRLIQVRKQRQKKSP